MINWLSSLLLHGIKYPKVIILILALSSCKNLLFFNRSADDPVAKSRIYEETKVPIEYHRKVQTFRLQHCRDAFVPVTG